MFVLFFLDTPCSQRSRLSPTIGSEFPDTLPVLDEQQQNEWAISSGTPLINKSIPPIDDEEEFDVDGVDLDNLDLAKDSDSNCEPIPSDENDKKFSAPSTGSSISAPPLLPSNDQLFIQQLSDIALNETVCYFYSIYYPFSSPYSRFD